MESGCEDMNDSKKFKNKTNAALITEAVDRILELSRRGGKPFEMFIRQNPAWQVEGTPPEFFIGIIPKEQYNRIMERYGGECQ
jgi:hypothetical protein